MSFFFFALSKFELCKLFDFKLRSSTIFLSLRRVDPAPHTQHLLGPFEAIAQNSLLRSFSIVDSLANRQHSCRGSEELAIRFQATPNYFAAIRATPSGGRPRTPSYSELLRATPSSSELLQATPRHSEWLLELSELSQRLIRAARAVRTLPAAIELPKLKKTSQVSELLQTRGAQELRTAQSHSKHSELLRALPETPSYYPASPEPAVSGIASSSELPQ